MVTVLITAYNKEQYLTQAVESALAQTYPCTVLIGDDHSTDGTLEIAYALHALYPQRVGVYPRHKNLGLSQNMRLLWAEARTEYVAVLDADDYWPSDRKLAAQVVYLDRHPELSLCFTHALNHPNYRTPPTLHDVLRHNLIVASSSVYRKTKVPEWVWGLPFCDLSLHTLHGFNGIGVIPEPLTFYRTDTPSVFGDRGLSHRLAGALPVYKALGHYLPEPYATTARETYALAQLGMAILHRQPSRLRDAFCGGVPWPTVFKLFLGQSARMLGSSVSR